MTATPKASQTLRTGAAPDPARGTPGSAPVPQAAARSSALAALRANWPEYLMEAWGLGVLMLAGAAVAAVMQAPGLGFAHLAGPFWQRLAGGGTVAALAALLTYSRWGRQSGAHFNPATTLTFFLMGKVRPWDALFYVLFQTLGAAAGLSAAAACFGDVLRMPPVDWLATYPTGMRTTLPFAAEFLASFGVMSLILATGATLRAARYTGLAAAAATFLLGLFDVSASAGFSLNPARSLVSAVPSGHWDGFWIYLVAPPAGMALAAFVNRRVVPLPPMLCAKLVHDNSTRCIHCGFRPIRGEDRGGENRGAALRADAAAPPQAGPPPAAG